jgi:hypothetical protein
MRRYVMTDEEMSNLVDNIIKRLQKETPTDAVSIIILLVIGIFKLLDNPHFKTIEEFADHLRESAVDGYRDGSSRTIQ